MTKPTYCPAPGEGRTTIIVWEVDDPAKAGDRRYWWDEKEVARLRELSSDVPDLAGKPRGESLASLRQEADGDEVESPFPSISEGGVRVSLARWRHADAERTYLIVAHQRAATDAEREALEAEGPPWPAEVEAIRQEWLAALKRNDERATELWRRLDASLKEHGFGLACEASPWDPDRAVEIEPGIYLQDERPS